ncbi:MAG: MFS transporter [Candidatus Heimdallarchaeaceae archaeon]
MLSLRDKIYYSICRFGSTILLNIVFVATFWMYTNEVELDPILNGIGNAVGKIVIGISSLIFGYLSDRVSKNRFGRRKFFIWTGAPALAFSFVMLFTPHYLIPNGGQITKFIWLIVWNSLFHLFYGYLLIPYQSMLPEITTENERVQVSALMNTVNLIGSALGSGFVLIMSGLIYEQGGIEGYAGKILLIFAIVFAVIEMLFFLPALLSIKEKEVEEHKRDLITELKTTLKNRHYVTYVVSFTILNVGVTILTVLMISFIEQVLGVENSLEKFAFSAIMFLFIILGFIFWSFTSKKIGKKWSLLIAFSALVIWMPLSIFVGKVPFIPPNFQGYIFGGGAIFSISAAYLFPYAILADFADKDERDTRQNRAGLYTGFKSLPFNIAQATGYIIAGYLKFLSMQEKLSLMWLGPIVTIFLIFAIPIIWLGDFDPFMKTQEIKISNVFRMIFQKESNDSKKE